MMTICLHNIECTAFHGVYAEEQKIGNRFIINVEVDIKAEYMIQEIEKTINYEILHEVVQQQMKKTKSLLETVVQELAHYILKHFVQAETVRIQLIKLHPPIAGFKGNVSVQYQASK